MNTAQVNLPDREAINLAREGATGLSKLLNEMPHTDRALIKMDGVDLILPRVAIELLREILADMSQGNAVSIVPLQAELTTQQAADYLNVSRPFLVKLLETGDISYTKVGTHRRIKFEDLIAYKEQMKRRSTAAMDRLVELAQEYKMGYE